MLQRIQILCSVAVILGLCLPKSSVADMLSPPTPSPTIGGVTTGCRDALGLPVFTSFGAPQDAAVSLIAGPGMFAAPGLPIIPGTRMIVVNPAVLRTMTPNLQQFVYAHECGHHMSGDIVAATYFRHDNLMREENADRIGIRLMRDRFGLPRTGAQQIADFWKGHPGMPPYYLEGNARAQWIMDCYNSNDDTCGNSSAVYTKVGVPSSQVSSTSASDQVGLARQMAVATKNSYQGVIGPNDEDGYPVATVQLTVNGQKRSCSIAGSCGYLFTGVDDEDQANAIFDSVVRDLDSAVDASWTRVVYDCVYPGTPRRVEWHAWKAGENEGPTIEVDLSHGQAQTHEYFPLHIVFDAAGQNVSGSRDVDWCYAVPEKESNDIVESDLPKYLQKLIADESSAFGSEKGEKLSDISNRSTYLYSKNGTIADSWYVHTTSKTPVTHAIMILGRSTESDELVSAFGDYESAVMNVTQGWVDKGGGKGFVRELKRCKAQGPCVHLFVIEDDRRDGVSSYQLELTIDPE